MVVPVMTAFDIDFPRAFGEPPARAQLKMVPGDFFVEEQLGFEPSGSGEHLLLFIEKCDRNTQAVAEQLASMAGIKNSDVGYAGMKDRRAVTRQWFSLYLPKQQHPVFTGAEGFTLLHSGRHHQKLRRGSHLGNRFCIRLQGLQGEREAIMARLQMLEVQGAPNYYGEQRFGREGENLPAAETSLARARGKQQSFRDRLHVSVARAWLFNSMLAMRVEQGNWAQAMDGDPLDIPSTALWGRGRLASSGVTRALEEHVAAQYPDWTHFLEHCGLQQERRPCILRAADVRATWEASTSLLLEFRLPAGTYATALLRELCRWSML